MRGQPSTSVKTLVGYGVTLSIWVGLSVAFFLMGNIDVAWAAEQNGEKPRVESNLHRADFRVVGTKCAVCLNRIASELSAAKGVIKADVSIFAPYGGVVVYDHSKTSLEKIQAAIASEKVTLEGLKDKAIAKVPAVIVPEK